jgi:hypothetical protein
LVWRVAPAALEQVDNAVEDRIDEAQADDSYLVKYQQVTGLVVCEEQPEKSSLKANNFQQY